MTYVLPDLDYSYGALAPHIAPEIMELYHSKYHTTYVVGTNTALEQLAEARESGNFSGIDKLEKGLTFYLGGHINHSTFWKNVSPEGGGYPDGGLAAATGEYFGGFDGFQKRFNAAASGVQDSDWFMLVSGTLGRHLNINQLYDQQSSLLTGQIPLLQLDIRERAFYPQYKNMKGGYVNARWDMVNQPDATEHFIKAQPFVSRPPPKLIESD